MRENTREGKQGCEYLIAARLSSVLALIPHSSPKTVVACRLENWERPQKLFGLLYLLSLRGESIAWQAIAFHMVRTSRSEEN